MTRKSNQKPRKTKALGKVMIAALMCGTALTGCSSGGGKLNSSSNTREYDQFMGYVEDGDYAKAAAMETDDCEDNLGLKTMVKADSLYPEEKFGKLSDAVKKLQAYELSKYVKNRKGRSRSSDGAAKTYTVSESCEIMKAPSFQNVFSSAEYKRAEKKAIAGAKGKSKAEQQKIVGDATGDIVYNRAKRSVDTAVYEKGKIKVTIDKNGKVTDVIIS